MKSFVVALVLALCSAGGSAEWVRGDRSPSDAKLWFTVAVAHAPEARRSLEAKFWAVSDPTSPSFARHLSAGDVDDLMRPPAASVASVTGWLRSVVGSDAELSWSAARDFVSCSVSVAQAEALLPGAEYHAHTKAGTNRTVHRAAAGSFALPAHIDFVSPTTRFPSPLSARVTGEGKAPAQGLGSDPTSISSLYGLGDYEATGAANNSQQVRRDGGRFARRLLLFFYLSVLTRRTSGALRRLRLWRAVRFLSSSSPLGSDDAMTLRWNHRALRRSPGSSTTTSRRPTCRRSSRGASLRGAVCARARRSTHPERPTPPYSFWIARATTRTTY